jgi:hypothetical protein
MDKTSGRMAEIYSDALRVYVSRSPHRAEIWRKSGARGMAFHVYAKAERVFAAVQSGRDEWQQVVKDEAPDIINYCAFLLIQAGDSNLSGSWPWE